MNDPAAGDENTPEASPHPPSKQKSTQQKKEQPSKKGSKGETAPQEDPKVQKLKRICKQAGIAVSPNVYQQSNRIEAFTQLLAKHNLTAKSSALLLSALMRAPACLAFALGCDHTSSLQENLRRALSLL